MIACLERATHDVEIPMTAHDRRRVRRIVEAPDGARFRWSWRPARPRTRAGAASATAAAYVVAAAPEDVLVVRRGTSRKRRGSDT
jgi:urease accessory protein UreE